MVNWSYISGFLDADGSVGLINNKFGHSRTPRLVFYNNELCILEEIQNFILNQTGFKGYLSVHRHESVNHKTSYALRYSWYPGCSKIIPHLKLYHKSKKHRCKVLIKLSRVVPSNGKYNTESLLEVARLEKLFFE